MPKEQCDRCGRDLEAIWDYPRVSIDDVEVVDEITPEGLKITYGGPLAGLLDFQKTQAICAAANSPLVDEYFDRLLDKKGKVVKVDDLAPEGFEENPYDDYSYSIPGTSFFLNIAHEEARDVAVISLMERQTGSDVDYIAWADLATIKFTGILNPDPIHYHGPTSDNT